MDTRLAVFVLTFNGMHLLDKCLSSIIDEGHVVIVDNGSTDGTSEYVQKCWPTVEIVRIDKNVPLGKALNIAVFKVKSEYIALLNNDVIGQPGSLRYLTGVLQANSAVGIVSPELRNPDGSSQEYGLGLDLSGFPVPPNRQSRPILDAFFQSGCVTVLRRVDFLAVGGYSEYLEWYTEDLDLAWKLRGIGKSFLIDDRASFVHLGGATLGKGLSDISKIRRRAYLRERNIWLAFYRNADVLQWFTHAPFIALTQVLECIGIAILGDRKTAAVYVDAWRDAVALFPRVAEHRRQYPTRRTAILRYVVPRWAKLEQMLTHLKSSRIMREGPFGHRKS